MSAKSATSGRPGSLGEARELVALVASLSEAGDALTQDAVSSRLGVSAERASALIELVFTAAGADGARLPLVEETDGVTLAFSQGMRGRRLRLTRSETVALAAALESLGVPTDDPLRARLEQSSSAEPVSEQLVERLVGGDAAACSPVIEACADALARRSDLAFAYQKVESTEPAEERLVSPTRLHLEDGTWYLDAFDLHRQGERTFRIDRMAHPELRPHAKRAGRPEPQRAQRLVRLTFADERYLSLLPWHDLRGAGHDPQSGAALFDTPFYGGAWLARMVAACGGTCTTTDPELAALVRDYAEGLLASS